MTPENFAKKKITPIPPEKPWHNGSNPAQQPKNPECMKKHDKRDGRK